VLDIKYSFNSKIIKIITDASIPASAAVLRELPIQTSPKGRNPQGER